MSKRTGTTRRPAYRDLDEGEDDLQEILHARSVLKHASRVSRQEHHRNTFRHQQDPDDPAEKKHRHHVPGDHI